MRSRQSLLKFCNQISTGKWPANYLSNNYFANNVNISAFYEVLCQPKLIHINVVSSRLGIQSTA